MQGNSSSFLCPQLLPPFAFLPCSSLHPLPAGGVTAGGMGTLTRRLYSPAGTASQGGEKLGSNCPASMTYRFNLSELALASLKLCELWDILPSVCCSWAAGPQVMNGANKDTASVCKPGVGERPFLGNQAGNTTHSAEPGRVYKC